MYNSRGEGARAACDKRAGHPQRGVALRDWRHLAVLFHNNLQVGSGSADVTGSSAVVLGKNLLGDYHGE